MNKIETICVYGASSSMISETYKNAAFRLGRILAGKGIRLVNGAGKCGLMGACSDACIGAGGEVTGIIPHFMVEQGWQHRHLTHIIETVDMHERKSLMAKMSDAAIALPGGCGTIEELMELITWKQLGLYLKPIVLLNTDNFFEPLLSFLQKTVDEHFMRPQHTHIWHVAKSPEEAVDLTFSIPLWNKEICKFAAI